MALSQDRAPQSLMSNHDVPSKWFKMAIGTGFAKATLVNQLEQLFPRNVILCNAKTSSIHRICWDFTSQEDLCSAWNSKVGMACYGIWRFSGRLLWVWKLKSPKAATCGYLRPLAGSGHLRPLAGSGHLRPLAATRWERPLAATCGHSLGAATCGHLRSLAGAATCGHLRPLAGSSHSRPLAATRWELSGAATCGHSLGAATCGHLRPLAWSGLAATRVAASGCVLVEIHGRVGILKKIGFAGKAFFFKFGGWIGRILSCLTKPCG